MGGYSPGQDPDLDLAAVQLWPQLMGHIQLTMRNLPLRRLWPGFRALSLERHNEF